ncbi:hypothetical protein ASPTUDRAFT_660912 [Aspergillus tubingensis CBS 134.48]|uniref:Uncharacterized protein n=1 Tax=Aspergillus tubingensis (strain CBS 134.48) TaxID=767770 RepID=A0A1L9N4Z0_ASPTC|nr:hypothetical protein ASPTUDRAFT_660912 [Aspergillus tubingensis CBS 134.48]
MYVCMHTSLHAYTTGSATHLVDRYRMICCITILSRFSVLLSSDTTKNLGLRPRQKRPGIRKSPRKRKQLSKFGNRLGLSSKARVCKPRQHERMRRNLAVSIVVLDLSIYLSVCLSVCLPYCRRYRLLVRLKSVIISHS